MSFSKLSFGAVGVACAMVVGMGIVQTARASDPDIVGDWTFDEGGGQVAGDTSTNANDGQLGSTPSTDGNDPIVTTGPFGDAALSFGGDDFVKVPESATLEPSTAITVEAWVRSSVPQDPFAYIVAKSAQGCSAFASYALYTGALSGLIFYVHPASGRAFVLSPDAGSGVWDDGEWHHAAGTFDGNIVRLYLDAIEVGSGSPVTGPIGFNLQIHNRLYIGKYHHQVQEGQCTRDFGFKGDIDEVRVWTRALSPEEVALRAQGQELPFDTDGDGVNDADDACPNSDLSPTIVIGGEDTGVQNDLVGDGCSLSDLITEVLTDDPPTADVVQFLVDLRAAGIITGREMGAILHELNDP